MTAIKEGGRVRATIEGTARVVYENTVSIEYVDVDGDLQRASWVPIEDVTPLVVASDTGTPADLVASGLAKGSVVNDDDHEDGDASVYKFVYVGDDTWLALQGDFETFDSADLESQYGTTDETHDYGVFVVEYSA